MIAAADRAALVGVVGQAVRHQQGAEVRVAEAELAEGARVAADLLGRVARRADDDLLREEDDVDRVLEGLDVEAAVVAAELHQVDRGQVAGRVVDVHVLGARVGGVDPARLRAGVPVVDRRVVLDARVGAAPGGVGDLAQQVARRRASSSARRPLRAVRSQSSPRSTASMNSSVTRTELLAFWYWIEWKASPSRRMSKPASRRAAAFSSSRPCTR